MLKNDGTVKKFEYIDLPNEESSAYLEALINNCIAAYSVSLSDSTALDFNKIPENLRALILENEGYRRETRSIRAKKIMDEVRETEYLADAALKIGAVLDEEDDEEEMYDPRRPPKPKKEKPAADKDAITMRFKAAQLRRDLLNLSAGVENTEEAAALHAFYISLTREEFTKSVITNVHVGEESGREAFKTGEGDGPAAAAEVQSERAEPLYMTHENGDVEEL